MVQVDFSEEERWRREMAVRGVGGTGGLTGKIIKYGLANDERQANQVLVIILIGILAITAILLSIWSGII